MGLAWMRRALWGGGGRGGGRDATYFPALVSGALEHTVSRGANDDEMVGEMRVAWLMMVR